MRERELTVRRRRAVVFGIVVLVVAVGLFHLGASPTSSPLPPPAPEERPQEPPPATPQETVAAVAHVDAVAPPTPAVADLTFLCGELLNPVDGGYPSADDAADDCQSALNARFSSATTAKALVPLERPMAWSDVFDDVEAGFQAVSTAVRDPACQVAAHDLRPDLAERCSARDMAELAVLGDVCGTLLHEFDDLDGNDGLDGEQYLTTLDADARQWAMANLDAGRRFTGNILYLNQPRRRSEALNAPLVDQSEYWRQRERIDEVYFRTAWLRSRCEERRETLGVMLPHAEELDSLLQRAAGFGDEFALAHSWQSRWRASKLQDTNLLLAWVHLGESHAAAVDAEWRREDQRVTEELEARSPYFESRLRALELAGIECESPCTPERLRETEQRFERERNAFRRAAYAACSDGDCQHLDALTDLRRQLAQARASPEAAQAHAQSRALYGKRAEALRMRYALAVEALAAERGVPLDVGGLWRALANPQVPRRLDQTEVEHLRGVADQMIAHALTHPTWAIPSGSGGTHAGQQR